jgi:PAP2 superfamily
MPLSIFLEQSGEFLPPRVPVLCPDLIVFISFIAWYYHVAPSHSVFAVVRRTITLTNFLAFSIFIAFPCMPPRLLPPEYGFLDSVRHDDAQSVWMSGKYVNALAAMPSMHFGYSFCIGCTLIYHSGVLRRSLHKNEVKKSTFWKVFFFLLGTFYPTAILITIIATANHYWLDAMVATGCACIAYLCNRIFLIFLPLEDLLLWALRVEKPTPSTGQRYRR